MRISQSIDLVVQHLPALKDVPEFKLKAIWSRSESSVKSLNEEAEKLSLAYDLSVYHDSPVSPNGGLSSLLAREDIKTVILSLPIVSQPDIIRKAWEAGKNVISEKPVAKDIESAKELIQTWETSYKPKGIHWIIAEQYPYEPAFVEARKILASGEIGELRSFSFDLFGYTAIGTCLLRKNTDDITMDSDHSPRRYSLQSDSVAG